MRAAFRRLTIRHYSWMHFKAALTVWMVLLLIHTPERVASALGGILVVLGVCAIVGACISVVGLVLSAQRGVEVPLLRGARADLSVLGVVIELGGLVLAAAGPFGYLVTQWALAATLPDGDQRIALVAMAYCLLAAFACRLVIVLPRFTREAHTEGSVPVISGGDA